jgi:ferredoxin
MKTAPFSKFLKSKRSLAMLLVAFGAVMLVEGLKTDLAFIRAVATYGNYDVSGTQSWIMKLLPGTADLASGVVYGEFHVLPLIIIGCLFILMMAAALFGNTADLISRVMVQWSVFALARLGVLRVSGICPLSRTAFGTFNFLNCQACEMATGACPIGMLQWSMIRMEFPFLVLGVIILSGTLVGRGICGWLCPFGFLSDVIDRISLKRYNPPAWLGYLKFLVFIFILTAFLWPSALFCTFLCQSGTLYGLMPYYLTTGLPAFKQALQQGNWMTTMLGYHLLSGLLLIAGMIFVSGRWFCRYLCPLGAIYGLFNYVSPLQVVHDKAACNGCGSCSNLCPMGVKKEKSGFLSVTGCIKCGRCVRACKMTARQFSLSPSKRNLVLRYPG